MSLILLIVSATIAAVLAYAFTPLTIRLAKRLGAMDQPSDRKVHAVSIPRLGGIAVIAAAGIALLVQMPLRPPAKQPLTVDDFWLGLILGLIPIALISMRDDIRGVRPLPKLAAQIAGASIAVWFGIRLAPQVHLFEMEIQIGWAAVPLSILWLIGVTNAFNLVDGLDGLSGGLAFISAISLGTVSIVARRPEMATASFILAGALVGFLPFNVHPARVFLGDTGATTIGFTLAALALSGGSTLSAGMAILVPVLVLGLPIAETIVSMARRAIRRAETASGRMMDADRNHFHHRLLRLGLTHSQAVYVLYGAGLVFAASAVASMFMSYRNAAMLLVVFIGAAFIGLHKLGYDEFALIRRGTVLKAYDVPVLRSTLFVMFVDLSMVIAALYAALVLKYDEIAIDSHRTLAIHILPIVVATTALCLVAFRVYRSSWRLASAEDLIRPTLAVVTAGAASWILANVLNPTEMPVSLQIMHTVLLLGFINGSRASYRILKQWGRRASTDGVPILIYGAGVAGTMAVREALSKPDLHIRPIGFIDDNERLRGRFVNGLPVVGSLETLAEVLADSDAAGVVIATDKLTSERVQEIAAICDRAGRWTQYFTIQILSKYDSGMPEKTRVAVKTPLISGSGQLATEPPIV